MIMSRIPILVRRRKSSQNAENTCRSQTVLGRSLRDNTVTTGPKSRDCKALIRSESPAKSTDCEGNPAIPISTLRAIHPQHLRPCEQDRLLEQRWLLSPTEKVLSSKIKTAIIEDLKASYWWNMFDAYQIDLSSMWESRPIQYNKIMQLRNSSRPPPFREGQLKMFCNKATTAYLLPSTIRNIDYPRLHLACMDSIWLRCFDQKPKMGFGYYFASPVHVRETGPLTVSQILDVHASLCDHASKILADPESVRAAGSTYGDPSSVKFLLHQDPIHFKNFPLCRALIILIDRFEPKGKRTNFHERVSIPRKAHVQTVLLLRTGDLSGLSAPIDFEPLRSKCVPLDFQDCTVNSSDIIRVDVATAVNFITELLLREEAAFPNAKDNTQDESLCHLSPSFDKDRVSFTADEYCNRIMEAAEERGIDEVWETWESVRRIKARERGESFREERFQPLQLFNNCWSFRD